MTSARQIEHFVTLFDGNFLPMGLALHESLLSHAQPFHLWIICMDELVETQLEALRLHNTTLIPVRDVETPELLSVKAIRTRGEYCWTLTPFAPEVVFDLMPEIRRVTYLDADVFFYSDPKAIIDAFERSGKQVLMSEHGYDPKYDQTDIHGRFCVQFMTFANSEQAMSVLHWWQERCLEWCYAKLEDGKFGDQKYLDVWPELFGDYVYIVEVLNRTLAPWNVQYFSDRCNGKLDPIFYHFHGLRLISPRRIRLYAGYRIGSQGQRFYKTYTSALRRSLEIMNRAGIRTPYFPEKPGVIGYLRLLKQKITSTTQAASL